MAFVRGANPIWSEFDTSGNLFDDTYYLFVLENTIPYIPATVYHDPDGNIPWTFPIPFQANGTLPDDIFFDPSLFYRLEFRHGPTQSDPLIGNPIDNYSSAGGSSPPTPTIDLLSDNQITNPQFSLIDFSSPYTITSGGTQNVDVAPGWVLELIGTGNAVITQVPLNDSATTLNSSNAPYALEINVNGTWTSVILRQRFQQNGMLWANKTISSTITARIEGASNTISATLVDSNNTVLGTVLSSTTVTSTFEEYTGSADLGATTNPDLPPAAYVDYHLILPTTVDIYVTSFQLVVGVVSNIQPTFQQDTIDRQIDYTFHNYRNSLLFMPKSSVLTGLNCSLNPWQAVTTASTTLTSRCAYTADQIIVYQQTGTSEVAIGRGSLADNYPFEIKAVTATNQFAAIEYIDPATIRPYWNETLSALLRAKITTSNASEVAVKMRLIYRASLPSTIGAAEPISSWSSGGDPTFSAGWTALTPLNDPVYTLTSAYQNLAFNQFQLPVSTNANMTLGIVIYTVANMTETGTADTIQIERCSLVPNEFAIDSNVLTFDENLNRCQYYWEQTYPIGTLPNTAYFPNAIFAQQVLFTTGGNETLVAAAFGHTYTTIKRATPALTFYSGEAASANTVEGYIVQGGAVTNQGAIAITNWANLASDTKSFVYRPNSTTTFLATATAGAIPQAFILFQFTANSRLGV